MKTKGFVKSLGYTGESLRRAHNAWAYLCGLKELKPEYIDKATKILGPGGQSTLERMVAAWQKSSR